MRKVLQGTAQLHRWLEARIGLPYRLLITVGLVITIAHGIRDIVQAGVHLGGMLSLILQFALLLDTATSLHERLHSRDQRRSRRETGA